MTSNSPPPDKPAIPLSEDSIDLSPDGENKNDDTEDHHTNMNTFGIMSVLDVCSFCEELIMAHNKQTTETRLYEGIVVKSKVFYQGDKRIVKGWDSVIRTEVPNTMSDRDVTTILTCKCNPKSSWPKPRDVHTVDLIEILPEVKLATHQSEIITGVFPIDFELSKCSERLHNFSENCSRLEKKLTHTQDYLLFGLPEKTANFIKDIVGGPVTTSNFPRIFQDLIFEERIEEPTQLVLKAVDRYRAYMNKQHDTALLAGAASKQGVNLLAGGFNVEPWNTFLGLFPDVNNGLRILQSKKFSTEDELRIMFPHPKDIWNEIKSIEGSLDLLIPDKFWSKISILQMPDRFKDEFVLHTQEFIKLYKKNLISSENWEYFSEANFNIPEAIKEYNGLAFAIDIKRKSYFIDGINLKPELRALLVSSEGWKFYDSVIRGLDYTIENGNIVFTRAVSQTRASAPAKQSSEESKDAKGASKPTAQSVSSSASNKSSERKNQRTKKQRSPQSSPQGSPPKKKPRSEFLSELRTFKAEGKTATKKWWNEFEAIYPKRDRSPHTK
jgi:hypothetical protein